MFKVLCQMCSSFHFPEFIRAVSLRKFKAMLFSLHIATFKLNISWPSE